MPETIGTQLIFRIAWPPAVVVIACLPLLNARNAEAKHVAEFAAATQYLLPICVMLGLVSMWLVRRKPSRL
jgi:hypothetical protein